MDWFSVSNSWLYKFKWHTRQIEWGQWIKNALIAFFNQMIVTYPLAYIFNDSLPCMDNDWNISNIIYYLMRMILIEEIFFYYAHRLLHQKWIYNYIHSYHHKWAEPIAVMTISAHPVEHLLSNVLPLTVSSINVPYNLVQIWIVMATANAIIDHSGYYIFIHPNDGAHDLHHRFRTCNFGVIGLLDYLHNTVDKKYIIKK
jgi:methylsterol monooxygenase